MTDYTDRSLYTEHSNAQSNRWFAIIDGMPGIEMKLHNFIMPALSIGITEIKHSGDTLVDIPGDTFRVDPVVLEFLIDARYLNYFHAYRWMRECVNRPAGDFRDITILLLDNQGNPQGVQVVYKDCYPTALEQLELDADGEVNDLIAVMTIETNGIEISVKGMDGKTMTYPEGDYYEQE